MRTKFVRAAQSAKVEKDTRPETEHKNQLKRGALVGSSSLHQDQEKSPSAEQGIHATVWGPIPKQPSARYQLYLPNSLSARYGTVLIIINTVGLVGSPLEGRFSSTRRVEY